MRNRFLVLLLILPTAFTFVSGKYATAQDFNNGNLQIIEGALDKNNKVTQEDGAFYALHPLKAKKGQKIITSLQAEGFKPAFNIGNINGGKLCLHCATGHKSGENKVVGIYYAHDNSPLQIRISTMRPKEFGKYKLATQIIDPQILEPMPINIGQHISASIRADDVIDSSLIDYDATFWGSIDGYYIDLKAHQNIEINITSDKKTPELKIFDAGNKQYNLVLHGANANFSPPHDGRYKIYVSNNNTGDLAIADPLLNGEINYNLIINRAKSSATTLKNDIHAGEIINSTFDRGKDLIASRRGDLVAKDYVFKPQIGKKYWISAQSNDTDISIWLGEKLADGEFNLLQSDDDNAGGTGAKLLFQSTDNKPRTIRLFSNYGYSELQKKPLAEYVLSIKEMVIAPPANDAKPIKIGDKLLIELKDGGARNSLGALYDIYKVTLNAGENISVFTNDFNNNNSDTYLEIGSGTPANFTPIVQDEDHGSGNNAKIKFTAPNKGEYLIRASSTNSAREDKFYLNIIPTPLPTIAPLPIEITIATEINGELNALSPVYGDDEVPYKDYIFYAQKGKKYKLALKSDDFYANIMARPFTAVDDKFIQSMDNTPISPPIVQGTKNNILEYTSPIDGNILVRVTSSVDNQIGKFALSVNEMVDE